MNALQDALHPAGIQASHIAALWWFTVAVCGVVFVAILAGLFYALRHAPRADAASVPDMESMDRPESGAKRVVVTAVVLSAIGLLVLLAASVVTDRALATLPLADAVHIGPLLDQLTRVALAHHGVGVAVPDLNVRPWPTMRTRRAHQVARYRRHCAHRQMALGQPHLGGRLRFARARGDAAA